MKGRKMRRSIRHSVVLILCLLAIGNVFGQANQGASSSAEPASDSKPVRMLPPYLIQPNDVLEIFVWKEPTLTRKVLVRPDGRISFPLVQDMQAASLTPAELKERIETKLIDYMEVPNVTVIVEAIQSYRIFVTGKVMKAGAIIAEKPL